MSCALIYLSHDCSSSPPGVVDAPPTPVWTNPAIAPAMGDQIVVGQTTQITVTVRNHDPGAAAPGTQVQLYWADPSLNFPVISSHLIGVGTVDVPIQTTAPLVQDGATSIVFPWTPTAAIAANNGGHVCLLAEISFPNPLAPCPPIPFPADPVTSPQGAIHNIQLVAMPPGGRRIWFGFGLSNTGGLLQPTRIVATPLDPGRDRARLMALLRDRRVDAFVRHANGFAAPQAAGVLLGRERIVIPAQALQLKSERGCHTPCPVAPRLGHTGLLRPELIPILADSKPAAHQNLELAPAETRQAILELESNGKPGEVHVVEIRQELVSDGSPRVLGGLTVVAVQPKHFC